MNQAAFVALNLAWLSTASARLDLLLQLTPCDTQDAFQQWQGAALTGRPSTLLNVGSHQCVSHLTEQPGQIAGLSPSACGDSSSAVLLRTGSLVLRESGRCIEAAYERGVQGVYFIFNECYDADSPRASDQLFVANNTVGQPVALESVSLPGFCVRADAFALPKLRIQAGAVISHGFGDMNIAFHFAYSAGLAGVCGHDSQPYHCAVQYFPGEALVPQTRESSVPYCDGCPAGMTLVYDHCKNHPEWVDVGRLGDYPRGNNKIDDLQHVYNSSVYLSRAECGTYGEASVVNTWSMYAQLLRNPTDQILYRDMCAPDSPVPFPYQTSPDPFVEAECLKHVYGPDSKMAKLTGQRLRPPASTGKREPVFPTRLDFV